MLLRNVRVWAAFITASVLVFGGHCAPALGQPYEVVSLGEINGKYVASGPIPLKINDLGQVAGIEYVGAAYTTRGWLYLPEAFHGLPAGLHDVGSVQTPHAAASGVNTRQVWVGQGKFLDADSRSTRDCAATWNRDGQVQLGSVEPGADSNAFDINEDGVVVGISQMLSRKIANYPTYQATIWTAGVAQLLPLPAGYLSSRADGINSQGVVVGTVIADQESATNVQYPYSLLVDNFEHAQGVMWENGRAVMLTSLLVPGSPWSIMSARDINDFGEIVGTATTGDGTIHTVILRPLGAPSQATRLGDAGVLARSLAMLQFTDSYDLVRSAPAFMALAAPPPACDTLTKSEWCSRPECWNKYHPKFNTSCYGCDGLAPGNSGSRNGKPGWSAEDLQKICIDLCATCGFGQPPSRNKGGPGGKGAPGDANHPGGAGGPGGAGTGNGNGGPGGNGGNGGPGGVTPGGSGGKGGAGSGTGSGGAGGNGGSGGGQGGAGGNSGPAGGQGNAGGNGGAGDQQRPGGAGGDGGTSGGNGSGGAGGTGGAGSGVTLGGSGGNGGPGSGTGNGGSGGTGGAGGGSGGTGGNGGYPSGSGGVGGRGGDSLGNQPAGTGGNGGSGRGASPGGAGGNGGNGGQNSNRNGGSGGNGGGGGSEGGNGGTGGGGGIGNGTGTGGNGGSGGPGGDGPPGIPSSPGGTGGAGGAGGPPDSVSSPAANGGNGGNAGRGGNGATGDNPYGTGGAGGAPGPAFNTPGQPGTPGVGGSGGNGAGTGVGGSGGAGGPALPNPGGGVATPGGNGGNGGNGSGGSPGGLGGPGGPGNGPNGLPTGTPGTNGTP